MNKGYIAKGRALIDSPEHVGISILEDVPVVGHTWTCACGAVLDISYVLPIETTEYRSRCLTTTKGIVDERRTTC